MPAELELGVVAPALPYWEAFWILSAARTVGGGMTGVPNPIAVSEILGYATARGLDRWDTVALVQQLDRAWLDLVRSQMEAAMKQAKNQRR